MNFELTEEQLAIQAAARNFAKHELNPYAKTWDETSCFPIETFRKAAELGFGGMYVKSEVGGSELNRFNSAFVFEEFATACVSSAAYLSVHNMVAKIIDNNGTNSQRKKWLPRLCTMELLGSYCLTEPNSGSDAAALTTSATREGDYYVLNGTKAFISGGSASDVYICMIRTGSEGPHGISCLVVEKGTPGLSFGKKEEKLGWRNQPTTMVFFENCRVPIANLIGPENEGFKTALSALNGGRINIAACALGGAQTCLIAARNYMLERQQFGKKLAEFEALQFKIADMATNLAAARLMVYRSAAAFDNEHPETPMYCAMAKCMATDICFQVSNEALQIFGGYGYLKDYPIERFFRDLRVLQILEGTNEIMRFVIARRILSENFQAF